jgi:hypothetical protein
MVDGTPQMTFYAGILQSEFTLSIAARCAIVCRMNPLNQRWTDDDLNTYALTTASAAAGCALGILFGRGMSRT